MDKHIDFVLVSQTASRLRAVIDSLPDESARIEVLRALLVNRCPKCLDYDERGQFWCCHDSRGG